MSTKDDEDYMIHLVEDISALELTLFEDRDKMEYLKVLAVLTEEQLDKFKFNLYKLTALAQHYSTVYRSIK